MYWVGFVGFDNFCNFLLDILIFVTLGDIFWFYSTTFFNNINIMFIESFCKLSFLVITLFSSISVISLFSKNPLLVRNSLMKVQNFLFVVMPLFVTLLKKDFMFFFLKRHTSFVVFYKLLCLLW